MSPRSEIAQLLVSCKTNSMLHTHVSLGNPMGKFLIGTTLHLFWDQYIRALTRDQALSIAENPGSETPVLVDIDLKALAETAPAQQLYTAEDVKHVVGVYQQCIRQTVKRLQPGSLTCVVLEKDPYIETINNIQFIKNGFHLHFPKLFLSTRVQSVYIIPQARQLLIGTPFENAIDSNSTNVHWLIYGSSKPNKQPYWATQCFNDKLDAVPFETALADYQVAKCCDETIPPSCAGQVVTMLPRILSIFLGDRHQLYFHEPKPSVTTPMFAKFEAVRLARKSYAHRSIEATLQEVEQFLHVISPTRANDRADWLSIGYCLWNITEGDDEGLTCWLGFSEQSAKYDEAECIHLWDTMRHNNFTIGTIKHFAKTDNPAVYCKIVSSKSKTLINRILESSHNDVAELLYNEYSSEFVCASVIDKTWYQFIQHTWQLVERGVTLRKRISCNSGILMRLLRKKLSREHEAQNNEAVKNIGRVIKNLKSAPTKNNIMTECVEVFYNKNFHQLLNTDPNLVAFTNGIFDFTNNTFRDGKPEDYLSKQLNIEFIDYKTPSHFAVEEVDEFFKKIFPDDEVRDYFLWQASKVFVGGNKDKLCLMWVGSGNNGKTITQTLFEKLLGVYAIKLNTSVVTGKKVQNGAANPEMARLGDGVRWAVMEEPNADETINAGILKNLTGNDSFFARDLYCAGKTTREITPMFKLHLICNKLPSIVGADQATWNRIRVIPFESTFMDGAACPETIEEQEHTKQFPMDKQFTEKIPRLLQPLAWYLINNWRNNRFIEHKFEPLKVMAATTDYKQDNDLYRLFEQEYITICTDGQLVFRQVYAVFKNWTKSEYPAQTVASSKQSKLGFIKLFGPLVDDRYWPGRELKQMLDI